MPTLNALDPTPEQIKAFLSHKKAGEPVYMLNLLKFKDRASYKDGEDISGREAYGRYAKALSGLVKDEPGFGAVFGGKANVWLIGEGEGHIPTPRQCLKLLAQTPTAKFINTAGQVWRGSF